MGIMADNMIKSQVRSIATATVTATSWNEARYDEPPGQAALAQSDFTLDYAGELAGTSTTRLLIAYVDGDPAQPSTLVGDYVGYERVTGTLDGRSGSFLIEQHGRHEGGVARTTGRIVPESATGELAGLHGTVEAAADEMTFEVTFSYAVEPGRAVH